MAQTVSAAEDHARRAATFAEPATLEPITYVPVLNDDGARIGWKPSSKDRRRFEQGSGYRGTGEGSRPPLEPETAPARELWEIREDLELWGIGDEPLYAQLASLYAEKPLMADRIAARCVQGASTQSLHDPTAFLASRLRPRK